MLTWLHEESTRVHANFEPHIFYLTQAGDFKSTFMTTSIYYVFSKKKKKTKSRASGNLGKILKKIHIGNKHYCQKSYQRRNQPYKNATNICVYMIFYNFSYSIFYFLSKFNTFYQLKYLSQLQMMHKMKKLKFKDKYLNYILRNSNYTVRHIFPLAFAGKNLRHYYLFILALFFFSPNLNKKFAQGFTYSVQWLQ